VTRDSYLGIGAGAASQFGSYFYLNTFSVRAYIDRVNQGVIPVNQVVSLAKKERMAYWLFWRSYETAIDLARFEELFASPMEAEFPWLYYTLRLTGAAKKRGRCLQLTRLGAYLYHLVEKHYSLTYLNSTWEACQSSPWLEQFSLD